MAKISTERDLERFVAYLRLQPLPLDVQAGPWKDPRKLTANAYLWSAVYPRLVEVAGFDTTSWHQHYCGEFFGWCEIVTPSGHVEYRPVRSTTKDENGKGDVMKGKPFNDFLCFVESDCAKRGVFIERGAL